MTVSLMSLIFSCSVLKALPSPPFPESWQRVQLLAALYSALSSQQISAECGKRASEWMLALGVHEVSTESNVATNWKRQNYSFKLQ